MLGVEGAGVVPRRLLEAEMELGGVVGRFDAEPGRFAAAGFVSLEVADQRILDREYRVAAEILVAPVEDVRRDRLVAVGRNDEVNVRRAPRMAAGRAQHRSDGPVGKERGMYRKDGDEQIAALGVGGGPAWQVQLAR